MDSIMAPEPTPMAQMTLSHMRPHVSCWIKPNASSTEADTWVAPKVGASVALQLDRVDGEDPLGAGQAGALDGATAPMPPMPITATLSPGRTSAA